MDKKAGSREQDLARGASESWQDTKPVWLICLYPILFHKESEKLSESSIELINVEQPIILFWTKAKRKLPRIRKPLYTKLNIFFFVTVIW